ncbi:lysoplasmalogenase [Notolabrus celidotus]|uniref:lysoplasmalogenase n=1 Tax=Notolabrus celidotus TaxID=1203425 RepID=UPI0014901818|nr:lysoplasmalogenase [Notolabrus celidotus]XP_034567896.1 lysoplasmalogenase [Notolabrus celidotus]XP_034567897.1 lysoplasmalogenase [Notolabrus celidotus]XP_034567898.1 lysoplasmalogenase [Notolabrus celidotus]XP_034567899.1 lysoplasmalogenase [Notolabrus celidotus]XP_034567900.1 lysoplasmalogenase [Notolabrus celidotus]
MDILETDAYDRRQRRNTSCTLLFSLLPFFLSAALYFYMMTPDMPSSIMHAGVKSVPTLLLAAIVLSWNGGQSVLGVVGGLVFSAIGDCCLVWPELFVHGMGAFAVAHLLYSLTFLSGRYSPESSSSLNWFLYLILFVMGGSFYTYMYPFLQKAPESELIVPGVGVYVLLITIMGSLAARTRHAATLLGSLSFIVSDISLALRVFKAMPAGEHGHMFVMVTYYLAQLLIAVGDIRAVRNWDDLAKWKRS